MFEIVAIVFMVSLVMTVLLPVIGSVTNITSNSRLMTPVAFLHYICKVMTIISGMMFLVVCIITIIRGGR